MTCPRCGAPAAAAGALFCTRCGARFTGGAAAIPPGHPVGAAERSLHAATLAAVGGVGLVFGFILLSILLGQVHYAFGVFLIAAILAILPVPIYATIIVSLDRHVREPFWLLAAAFFWGALVAVVFSFYLNTFVGTIFKALAGPAMARPLGAMFSAPPVEETSKGLALLLIFLFFRAQLNDVVDGIVLGALVGLGFAMSENILYFERTYTEGGLIGVGINFYMRVILGGFGHPMYTAATGAGLGLAAETANPIVRWVAPVLGWFAAMFLHFLWNATASVVFPLVAQNAGPGAQLFILLPFQTLVLTLPGIATLLVITFFAWRRETRVIAEQLRDEVARGVVSPGEYAVLCDDHCRARQVWGTLFAHGPAAWYLLRQFYNEEVGLAFRKWHTSRGERLPSYLRGAGEDAHRKHIARLRIRLQHLDVATA